MHFIRLLTAISRNNSNADPYFILVPVKYMQFVLNLVSVVPSMFLIYKFTFYRTAAFHDLRL